MMTAATTIAPVFASATRPGIKPKDNKPLKESLNEKFAKFPISTSYDRKMPE